MIKRTIYTASCAFSGYFLGLRILGAVFQIFSFEAPLAAAFAFFVLCGAMGFLFCNKIDLHLQKYAFGDKPITVIAAVICTFLCYFGRYVIIDFQIAPYKPVLNSLSVIISSIGAGILLASFILHFICAFSKVFVRKYNITKKDIFSAALILFILNVLAVLFCKNNRQIAYWDNAGFWLTSRNLAKVFREDGLIFVIRDIFSSVFTEDYNFIIAVPTAVLAYIFGDGRMVYILGVVNFYLYPLIMFIYVFARRKSSCPLLCTLLTASAFPFLFFVSTQGYIDAGAIVLAALALWLWYADRHGQDISHSFIIGIVLAAAMVLRRWLVFFAIAYIAAFVVDSIVYKKKISTIIWLFVSLAFGLLFLFQPYVTVKLMANYSGMYSAYDLGLSTDFFTFVHYIGLIILCAALAVMTVMLIKKQTRREGLFMLLLLAVCFAVFVKIQSHGEQHLMLYIPALFFLICTGYSYLLHKKRIIAAAAVAAAVSVLPVYNAVTADNSKVGSKIVTLEPCISCMPSQREDADQILALDYWLDENVGDKGKRVAVLASSLTFNREILYNAEASLNIKRTSKSNREVYMPWLPQVDGRDDIPYEILKTEFVLVADPIQTHLAPENQKVVTVPAQSFLNNTDIANAFEKLDVSFKVGWDKSINVYIYEKVRDITPEEEAEFLEKFNQ